jgi:hypothetical protein
LGRRLPQAHSIFRGDSIRAARLPGGKPALRIAMVIGGSFPGSGCFPQIS